MCVCRSNSSAKRTNTPRSWSLAKKKYINCATRTRARSDNCPEVTHADAEYACKNTYQRRFTRKLILILLLFFFFLLRSVKNKQKKKTFAISVSAASAHISGGTRAWQYPSEGRQRVRDESINSQKKNQKKQSPPEISNPLGPRWSTYYFKMELH